MNKVLLLLITISLNLFGACLKVGTTTGQTCSGTETVIDSVNKTVNSMLVSENGTTILSIPLFVKTDSTDAVLMSIDNFTLKNSANEAISLSFEFVRGGTITTLQNRTYFNLLPANSGDRDGSTQVGEIIVKISAALSPTQTAGRYSLSTTVHTKFSTGSNASNNFNLTGTVTQVSMVGFENLATLTQDVGFKTSSANFGNFTLNDINILDKSVYVKNNTTGALNIKFNTTPLVSQVDSNYKINMHYYYTPDSQTKHEIQDNTYFLLCSNKQTGTQVGVMQFATERLTGLFLAGEYKATLHITVQAN